MKVVGRPTNTPTNPELFGGATCVLTTEVITIGEPGNIPVTGIVLDYSTISITEGEAMMLAASVTPSNATNTAIIWKSSNNGIATVNNGLVTAVASGKCTITATSAENSAIKATCAVAVEAAESEVTLTNIVATYSGGPVPAGTAVNDLTGIVVTANYSDGTRKTVTGYTLYGTIAEGSNTVTVTYGGKTATFTVTGVVENGTVKVQLATLELTNGITNKSGTLNTSITSGYTVEIPYIDGMQISTGMNHAWVGNYPPFIVLDNGSYTIPEYTTGDSFSVAGKGFPTEYTCILSGYSTSAKVYVNLYTENTTNAQIEETDKFWYSYES